MTIGHHGEQTSRSLFAGMPEVCLHVDLLQVTNAQMITPLMEALGLAELTHDAKANRMRAK